MTDEVNYDQIWSDWSDMSQHAPTPIHTRRLMIREAAKIPFASVLDVGCGMGVLIGQVSRRFGRRRYAGADIAATALSRGRRRFPDIAFYELDVQKEALPEQFDLVLCSEVIEHLEQPEAAMENLRRMCSGYLIMTTPTGRRLPTDLAFHHLRHFTPQQLTTLVEGAGFSVVKIYRWGWPFQVLFRRLINLMPGTAHDVFVRGGNYGIVKRAASAIWTALFYFNLTGLGTQMVLVARVRR